METYFSMRKVRRICPGAGSHGAYTIFLPSGAENTSFEIGRRERKWYFRPARQKATISYWNRQKQFYKFHS